MGKNSRQIFESDGNKLTLLNGLETNENFVFPFSVSHSTAYLSDVC